MLVGFRDAFHDALELACLWVVEGDYLAGSLLHCLTIQQQSTVHFSIEDYSNTELNLS